MKIFFRLHIALLLCFLFMSSCASPRWMVKDRDAVDRSDYRVLDRQEFLARSSQLTPDDPVLELQLYAKTSFEYSEKIQLQRTIQEYQIRPGFLTLGLAGAGLSFMAANSGLLISNSSTIETVALNVTGALLGVTGFINTKPVNKPEPTGEERYLRKTGTFTETDTVRVADDSTRYASISAYYGDKIIIDKKQREIESGKLSIDLGTPLNELNIQGPDPERIHLQVNFNDSLLRYQYPLQDILYPHARVTSPITLLRDTPEESPQNILAELVSESRLQIIEQLEQWYKVKYGLSENYIKKGDAMLLWRSSESLDENRVVAVPRIPFGSVDVENNIPILSDTNSNAYGLVISNEQYSGALTPRSYAVRDGRLVESYLENALGFENENIHFLRNTEREDSIRERLNVISSAANDSSEIVIYLNGYGSVRKTGDDYTLGVYPAKFIDSLNTGDIIDLSTLFKEIASLNARKILVFADIEFKPVPPVTYDEKNDFSMDDPLRDLSNQITRTNSGAAILFASAINQRAGLYVSKNRGDKKHHIFTYYLIKAIQNRQTGLAEINQFLERNVSYISRMLYDETQDPRFYGNISLPLTTTR